MRTIRVQGACLRATGAEAVMVEAQFAPAEKGKTDIQLTGLPDLVLRESKSRLLCALENVGLAPGPGRLALNLVPAGRRKVGEMLDLPLALGAAGAAGHLDARWLDDALFLGEVGIDGQLHDVPGGLAAAEAARVHGAHCVVAPPATAQEAANVLGLAAFGARSLGEVIQLAAQGWPSEQALTPDAHPEPTPEEWRVNALAALANVRGQGAAKRALATAALGGHALLFSGPPGTGKTLLARSLPALLDAPEREERMEITRVLSAAGLWPRGLARARPFRAPHHTVSFAGLVGGGAPPSPGEVSLAHRGVLFLDELPEFRREALEALREPLERGHVEIARASGRLSLPARFQLIAAMNPCPCGYRGHPRVPCRCAPGLIERYRGRISGPLLDRFELRVHVPAPELSELSPSKRKPRSGSAAPSRARGARHADERLIDALQRGRAAQLARGHGPNARLDADSLDECAPLSLAERTLIDAAVRARGLSARAIQSLRRIARSLADLAGDAQVGVPHLAEALALRGELEPGGAE